MKSRRRQLSLYAFMSFVTAICLVCGICKIWLFPPTLTVNVPSADQVVVNGNVFTMLDQNVSSETMPSSNMGDQEKFL